jgi:calcineurin-like phosphoesterase family protein
VTGPGLPAGGFVSSFHTRKRGGHFAFQVQGDEGYYPNIPGTNPPLVANYEARIINTMFNVPALSLPGQSSLPPSDFALNTGDNVYITGADSNYRDVWMADWNSNVASNERGAPFIRSIPLYIVAGNHDIGSTGATANLLADSGATVPGSFGPGPFGGGVGGGDALDYFNNYYYPLNGPGSVDIQNRFNADVSGPTNFLFTYNGVNYSSPAAIEALRASTEVDSGKGPKRQIDHMSNYSFDYGNAHFVFLDANPHLFNNLLPGGPPATAPAFPFPPYPTVLKEWLINDLDASRQIWKIVVFHQPIFSSGNATLSNDQMRTIGLFLQDHGANFIFNGHEHNYQRTQPLRALSNVTDAPIPGVPQVEVDDAFDGTSKTVPDGVLYFVEGAGGNRDFDDNIPNPRGGGNGIDQDDAATGTTTQTIGGHPVDFLQGVPALLDTSLSDDGMKLFLPNAGTGPKITARFKSKLFSFAHIVVDENELTLYQISEPLGNTSSASAQHPAPFGTDYRGRPVNDPIPDTVFDPVTKTVVSAPATGVPALLDKVKVTKPDISAYVKVELGAPKHVKPGDSIDLSFEFRNRSAYAMNGTQVVIALPDGISFEFASEGTTTLHGHDVVVSLGRTLPGQEVELEIHGRVSSSLKRGTHLAIGGLLRSSTALPVAARTVTTTIGHSEDDDGSEQEPRH